MSPHLMMVLNVVGLLATCGFGLVAIYYFYLVLSNLRSDKEFASHFIGVLFLFLPGFLTAEGERYRNRLFFFAAASLLSAVLFFCTQP